MKSNKKIIFKIIMNKKNLKISKNINMKQLFKKCLKIYKISNKFFKKLMKKIQMFHKFCKKLLEMQINKKKLIKFLMNRSKIP